MTILDQLTPECDEAWSSVNHKGHQQQIWLVLNNWSVYLEARVQYKPCRSLAARLSLCAGSYVYC